MIVLRTSVFPARREAVFERLKRLETLQYVASPLASFTPAHGHGPVLWQTGSTNAFQFKLFGLIPFGTHTIYIERFDLDTIQSREHNKHVHTWDHKITLLDLGGQTEYTDEVNIQAGWKTAIIWLWAKAFYAHRQRKWIRMLRTKS